MGGAGNDSLSFTGAGWTAWDTSKTAIEYYYDSGDGTDTLSFGGTTTGNAQVLGFNVLDSLYDTVTTELRGTTGLNIVGSNTSGGATTNTTIAYVLGVTQASDVVVTEVSQSVIDSVTALG